MDIQNYPTTTALGKKAWSLFQTEIDRVLEPSSGKGDLAKMRPYHRENHTYSPTVDCIEIDISQHPILREEGFNVVGIDFLAYDGPGAIYSHIIMNPPFANGVDHVLKAWDIMYDGEIVAIINAKTIRNPFSKERRMLADLVDSFGSVEYIEDVFSGPDSERKTEVEIALIYLRKECSFSEDVIGTIIDGLEQDNTTDDDLSGDFSQTNDLALPGQYVKNSVASFNAAVTASREAVRMEARYQYYSSLLGGTLAQRNNSEACSKKGSSLQFMRGEMSKRYRELKDRAWADVLLSTEVTSRLSSTAQRRLESDFEAIKHLEFTTVNIYSFLQGLSNNQGQIQADMACDVFDSITRYHSDNTVFYKGWKSNDKHRTCGMRIKTTRFILPRNSTSFGSLPWETQRMLADFDKVFAMLDSKTKPETSLSWVFDKKLDRLKNGERLSSSYFDVRYYPGVGTIHFFARDKKLIERLNLLVGRQRNWLPPQDTKINDAFWLQYNQAEKFDKELRKDVAAAPGSRWASPFCMVGSINEDARKEAEDIVGPCLDTVLRKHGIDPVAMLEHDTQLRLKVA